MFDDIASRQTQVDRPAGWLAEVVATTKLGWPIALAMLAEMGAAIAALVMAGRLGAEGLAAAGLGTQVTFTPLIIGMSAIASVSALGAQAYGGDQHGLVGRVVRQGLVFATLVAIPVMAFMLAGPLVLRFFGYKENLIAEIRGIVYWAALGVVPFLWFNVLRNLMTVLSRPRVVTIILVVTLPLSICLTGLFMFGLLGLPTLGVSAIGVSIAVTAWVQFVTLGLYVAFGRVTRTYAIFYDLLTIEWRLLADLSHIGWPIAASYACEVGMFVMSAVLIGTFGEETLAAHNMTLNIASVLFMIPYSLGQAATVRVGYALGGNHPLLARRAGFVALGLGISWMLMSAAIMTSIPEVLMSFYIDLRDPANQGVAAIGVILLQIAAIFQVADGLQVTVIGVLRGYKDTRLPMFICAFGYWILGLGSGYLLAFFYDFKGPGLWWGLAIGLAASGLMMLVRFQRLSRRHVQAGTCVSP